MAEWDGRLLLRLRLGAVEPPKYSGQQPWTGGLKSSRSLSSGGGGKRTTVGAFYSRPGNESLLSILCVLLDIKRQRLDLSEDDTSRSHSSSPMALTHDKSSTLPEDLSSSNGQDDDARGRSDKSRVVVGLLGTPGDPESGQEDAEEDGVLTDVKGRDDNDTSSKCDRPSTGQGSGSPGSPLSDASSGGGGGGVGGSGGAGGASEDSNGNPRQSPSTSGGKCDLPFGGEGAGSRSGVSRRTPVDILARIFPHQKRSLLQLVLQGCHGDVLQAIEQILNSHSTEDSALELFNNTVLSSPASLLHSQHLHQQQQQQHQLAFLQQQQHPHHHHHHHHPHQRDHTKPYRGMASTGGAAALAVTTSSSSVTDIKSAFSPISNAFPSAALSNAAAAAASALGQVRLGYSPQHRGFLAMPYTAAGYLPTAMVRSDYSYSGLNVAGLGNGGGAAAAAASSTAVTSAATPPSSGRPSPGGTVSHAHKNGGLHHHHHHHHHHSPSPLQQSQYGDGNGSCGCCNDGHHSKSVVTSSASSGNGTPTADSGDKASCCSSD